MATGRRVEIKRRKLGHISQKFFLEFFGKSAELRDINLKSQETHKLIIELTSHNSFFSQNCKFCDKLVQNCEFIAIIVSYRNSEKKNKSKLGDKKM